MEQDLNRAYISRDSEKFSNRRDLAISNANLFIANNNNPFLVSPYAPPANYAKQSIVNSLASTISSIIGDFSKIIDISTLTININNISSYDSTLNIFAPVELNLISDDIINIYSANDINVTTTTFNMNTTTFNVSGNANFDNLTVASTLSASTISTGSLTFETALGKDITCSTLNAQYAISFSSLNMIPGVFSTLNTSYTSSIFITIGGNTCLLPVVVL